MKGELEEEVRGEGGGERDGGLRALKYWVEALERRLRRERAVLVHLCGANGCASRLTTRPVL